MTSPDDAARDRSTASRVALASIEPNVILSLLKPVIAAASGGLAAAAEVSCEQPRAGHCRRQESLFAASSDDTSNNRGARARSSWTRLLLLIVFTVYAGAFIARTSGSIDGKRVFVLFDDAMVSMDYARNVVEGRGAVWTPGAPRVEGFTNPGWTAVMALVHLLPLPPRLTALPVQVLGATLLALNLFAVYGLARRVLPAEGARNIAVLLTAFYFPLDYWGLMGMEVSVLTLMTTQAMAWTLDAIAVRRASLPAQLLLGAAVLVRPDMIVALASCTAVMAVKCRGPRWRTVFTGVGIATAVLAVTGGLRLWYFGDLLPNTYYLKVAGVPLAARLARGIASCGLLILSASGALLIGLALTPLRTRRLLGPALAVTAGQAAYSVFVGGDAWEQYVSCNRYIVIAVAPVLVLIAGGLWRTALLFTRRLGWGRLHTRAARRPAAILLVVLTGATWASLSSWRGTSTLAQALLLERPSHVLGNLHRVRLARAIRGITAADASVAVAWAGIIPYFSGRPGVDLLGKNDPVVARGPSRLHAGLFGASYVPGHTKVNYGYSLGVLQPDVVAEVGICAGEAAPFLATAYVPVELRPGVSVFCRRNSPRVLWSALPRSWVGDGARAGR